MAGDRRGGPSPRTEVVHAVEPCRAALRQGDWKLVRQVALPGDDRAFDLEP